MRVLKGILSLLVFSLSIALSVSAVQSAPVLEIDTGPYAKTVANNFSVEWHQEIGGFHQKWNVSIQNLEGTNRDFDLEFLVKNGDLDDIKNVQLYEWKNISYNKSVLQSGGLYLDCVTANTNGTDYQDCTPVDNRTYADETFYKLDWKGAKTFVLSGGVAEKSDSYATINIPKYDSKEKDDTVNGTKWFQVVFDLNLQSLSTGQFAFRDTLSGEIYHPWWNASYTYNVGQNITSDAGGNIVNFPVVTEFDTATPIGAGKLQSDCQDFEPINETNERRDFEFEAHGDGTYGCNTSNTTLWTIHPLLESDDSSYTDWYYDDSTDTTWSNSTDIFTDYSLVWHLSGLFDSSPSDNSFDTLSNGAQIVTDTNNCAFGQCLEIPAVDRSASDGDDATHTPSGDTTIEFWVTIPTTPHAGGNDSSVVSKWVAGGGSCGVDRSFEFLHQFSLTRWNFVACMNNGLEVGEIYSNDIVDGNPIYIVMSFDDTNDEVHYWVNGTRIGTDAVAGASGFHDNGQTLYLGPNSGGNNAGVIQVYIDEFRIGNFNATEDYVYQNWRQGCALRNLGGCPSMVSFSAENENVGGESNVLPIFNGSTNHTYQGTELEDDNSFRFTHEQISFEMNVTDPNGDGELSEVYFETNFTGTFVNHSTTSGTPTVSNSSVGGLYSINFTYQQPNNTYFRWCADDGTASNCTARVLLTISTGLSSVSGVSDTPDPVTNNTGQDFTVFGEYQNNTSDDITTGCSVEIFSNNYTATYNWGNLRHEAMISSEQPTGEYTYRFICDGNATYDSAVTSGTISLISGASGGGGGGSSDTPGVPPTVNDTNQTVNVTTNETADEPTISQGQVLINDIYNAVIRVVTWGHDTIPVGGIVVVGGFVGGYAIARRWKNVKENEKALLGVVVSLFLFMVIFYMG